VAVARATPDVVSSSSEQDRACISATVNHCRLGKRRRCSAGSDMMVELQWMQAVESNDQIMLAEEVVQ